MQQPIAPQTGSPGAARTPFRTWALRAWKRRYPGLPAVWTADDYDALEQVQTLTTNPQALRDAWIDYLKLPSRTVHSPSWFLVVLQTRRRAARNRAREEKKKQLAPRVVTRNEFDRDAAKEACRKMRRGAAPTPEVPSGPEGA